MTSRPPYVIFDLDGTLFDTQHAVVVSYGEAGVQANRVIENWGKPWQGWVSTHEHSEKVRRYRSACADPHATPALPALGVLKHYLTIPEVRTGVCTGASHEATTDLLEREDAYGTTRLWTSMTWEKKHDALQALLDLDYQVVYIDDDDRAAAWMPVDASLILYVGQSTTELMEDVEWTLSYSPPART